MKQVQVTCAIIERAGRVLAARRNAAMKMALKWEFPGGKIEPGEAPEDCLHREIREELNLSVSIQTALPPVTHPYPDTQVILYPFVCEIVGGELELLEHAAVKWLLPEDLDILDWTEADRPVIDAYRRWIGKTAPR